MSQTAVDATKLIPLIEKAYGKDTVADSFDFGAINDQFNKEKAEKKAEVKSMTEIGADLDAARYSQIEGGLNDLMEQAKNGSIVVGSPEWVAKVSQWKTGAGHLKQAADLDAGITKMAYENPDTFQYITQDENGVIVNTGLKGYKRDLTALNNQEFADPQARVEAEAKIGQRVSVADRSVEDAYKRLQNEANDLNKELNKSANEVSKRVKVTLGSEVFEITSQIDEEHTQQVVDMFVNQFAEDLGGEYAKLAAQGRIPKDEKGKDLTPTEYINRQVKAFITRGEKKTTIMRRPAPKTSKKPSGLSSQQIESARNVKEDVSKLQNTKDPKFITDYISGSGFTATVKDGSLIISEIGRTKGETVRPSHIIDLSGDARAIYDAIAEINGDISREAIDYQSSPNIVKQTEWDNKVDDMLTSAADSNNTETLTKWLKGIDGVTEVETSYGYVNEITIDGKVYNLEDEKDAKKINTLLKQKSKSATNSGAKEKKTDSDLIEGYSNADVEAAAEASGLSVDEYVKRYNANK